MRLLIAYSAEQWGHDDVLSAFIGALAQLPKFFEPLQTLALNVDHENLPSDESFDAVICINALAWYIKNRADLKGRPWVCVVSFAMHDLHEFVRNISSAHDMGISAMFTNVATFVKQCSAAWPAAFMSRPSNIQEFKERTSSPRKYTFGTVLPNIVDRDFSQLLLTQRYVTELKPSWELGIWVHETETKFLPKELEHLAVPTFNLASAYDAIEYFIPAPRITDLRVGTMASEVIEAIARGCAPLLFVNPRLNEMDKYVSPHFTSLSAYKDAIKSIVGGTTMVDTQRVNHLLPTPASCATQIWTAYIRWMTNNATAARNEV